MPPPLPLYDAQAPVDAFHRVRSPGGYEQWYFDAETDPATDIRLIATFSQGLPFDPSYIRKYLAFLRHPSTRRPPLPEEYPVITASIYEKGRLIGAFSNNAQPSQFAATETIISIGKSHFERSDNGRIHVHLVSDAGFLADIAFTPTWLHPSHETIVSPSSSAIHRWIITQPLAIVEGDVHVSGRKLAFRGLGYHDHRYGTSPPNLRRWFCGRILREDRVTMFQCTTTHATQVQLIHANADGIHDGEAEAFITQGKHWTLSGMNYPTTIRVDEMVFGSPQLLDRSGKRLRLVYKNATDSSSRLLCVIR